MAIGIDIMIIHINIKCGHNKNNRSRIGNQSEKRRWYSIEIQTKKGEIWTKEQMIQKFIS